MASITVVSADAAEGRTPLLQDSYTEYSGGEGYTIPPPPPPPPIISIDPKQRLVSLDVFRGLTVALMILVDDAGGAFPSINHAPWFGLTLADFVMPFFLFGVGVSVSLVFKKVENRLEATKRVMSRSIKLFLLGMILQGGYFHGRRDLTYGIDVEKIRVMGVLQRIAIGYMLASALEIWLVNNTAVNSTITFMKRYSFQIVAGILVGVLYMVLLYGLYVPDWNFNASSLSMTQQTLLGANSQTVYCGIRGSLGPPCNAVGFIDRVIVGENHLYQRPVYRRTKECSVNSPDYGPPPPNSPAWCLAPFDPEGILSSLMAAITCLVGLHYGHILVHCKDQKQRIIIWFISSLPLLILGYLLNVTGIPLSKPLYTLSYMFVTAGASGVVLTVIYFIVDTRCIRKPTLLFQWMGMNALIVYALAACDIFPAAVQGFYWRSPKNNLQKCIADSTMEAEYVAASEAAKEAVWFWNYLLDLGVVLNLPKSIIIYCDNSGALANSKEPRTHKATKHIKRKYHIIREIVQGGDVLVEKINTFENLADPFTKGLPQKTYEKHARGMRLRLMPPS